MKKISRVSVVLCLLIAACGRAAKVESQTGLRTEMTRTELLDKVKGGWAGQVIGCTFGGPTEFRYQGAMIQDYQAIPWDDSLVAMRFEKSPGLYDDVYMDLTFVDVMAREGIDAPAAFWGPCLGTMGFPRFGEIRSSPSKISPSLTPQCRSTRSTKPGSATP